MTIPHHTHSYTLDTLPSGVPSYVNEKAIRHHQRRLLFVAIGTQLLFIAGLFWLAIILHINIFIK